MRPRKSTSDEGNTRTSLIVMERSKLGLSLGANRTKTDFRALREKFKAFQPVSSTVTCFLEIAGS